MSDVPHRFEPEASAAAVLAYLAALSAADVDRAIALLTDDFVNEHTSALGSGCVGRAAYAQRLPGFLASMPGLDYEVERIIADGGQVAAKYRLTAHGDGHPIDLRGVMVFDVVDGLIAHRTDYWDALTFLRQVDQPPPVSHRVVTVL